MLTLEEFISHMEYELETFVVYYTEGRNKSAVPEEEWPLNQLHVDWFEQYLLWIAEEAERV